MKLRFLYFLASCLLLLYVLQSSRTGVAATFNLDRTGSPIASGLNCGACHSGAFNNAALAIVVKDATNQVVTDYNPGDTYTVEYNTTNQFGFAHGVQGVALTPTNAQAGSFSNPISGTKISTLGGREYLEHTTPAFAAGGFTFAATWTAPGVGSGTVTFYGSGIVGNSDNRTSGDDPIAPVNLVLTERVAASIDYASATYCQNVFNPTPTQLGVMGGTYTSSPNTLAINAATGEVDLAASPLGTFTITYTFTGGTATDQITILQADDASFAYPTNSFCINQADPTPTLTGRPGGYYLGSAGLVVDSTTGTIDISASGTGTFTVGYFTNGSCPAQGFENITITNATNASFSYSNANYCQNGTDPTPTATTTGGTYTASPSGLVINASTGQVDLSTSSTGNYMVTYTTGGMCSNSSMEPVNILPTDNAAFSYSAANYCINGTDPTPTIAGLAGGQFSSTGGLTLNPTTGRIDVSTSTPGTYTVTYMTNGQCPNSSGEIVTIDPLDNASFSYTSAAYCQNGTNPMPTITGVGNGTFTSTTGLAISATTGNINLANSTPGNYMVTYTTTGQCPNSSMQAVTVNSADDASFTYTATNYCLNAADPSPTITGVNNGTFSGTAGLSINTNTGLIDVSASTLGNHTVTYTTIGQCPNTATFTLTINPLDNANFAYANAAYCQNASGNNPSPTISGLTGGTFSASSTGLVINATSGALNLSASTPGTYNVTYTTNGQCPTSSTEVVVINSPDNASFAYANTIYCQGAPNPMPTVTGLAGGQFTSTAGLILNAATGQVNLMTSTPGTYTIIYSTNGTCPNSASQNITVRALDNASFAYSNNSYCRTAPNPTPTITGVTGGNFSSTVGLALNANTGAINLATSTLGTYTVTYTTNGQCPNSSTQTLTITNLDDAGFAYGNASYCQSVPDPTPTITGLTGGQFSSTSGLVLNAVTGRIDVSASTTGIYSITYTTNGPCTNSSTRTVTINAAASAAFSYNNTNYCEGAPNPTPTITGGNGGTFSSTAGLVINGTTGQINLLTSTPGMYVVTYTLTTPCPSSSTQMVTIDPLDNATFAYSANSYCQTGIDPTPTIGGLTGGTFSSTSGLVLNANTGVIDLNASSTGNYTITYTTNGTCPNSSSNMVMITPGSNAGFAYSATSYCQGAPNTTPIITGVTGGTFSGTAGLIINTNTGQVDLVNTPPGTYTVTYTISGNCPGASTQTLMVAPLDNANFSYSQGGYCQTDADPTPTITGVNGGTFSSTGGLSINPTTGQIDVSASSAGTYLVTYTTNGVCPNNTMITVVINAAGNTSFAYSAASYCQSALNPTPTITGNQGGTFSSTAGLTINASTGQVDLANSTAGTYTITYTVTGTCGSVSTQPLTITPVDNANFSYSQGGYCQTDADPTPTITGVNGGTFSSTGGLSINPTTGQIDVSASSAGTYSVTYTTNGVCPNNTMITVVINAAGNTSFAYSAASYCQSALNPTPTITGNQGGTFSSTVGLTINSSTGQVDLANSTAGTYTITYTVTGTCGSTSTQTLTVAPVDNASFTYNQNSYCQTDADPTPTITGASGGTFSSTGGLSINGGTGQIDVSNSTPGTYTVTYATNGNCPNTSTQAVVINAAGNTSFTYSAASYCQTATNPTPTIAGNQGGTFTSTTGLTINANTGQVDLTNSTAGTYTITYTVTGTCGSASAQVLTITPVDNANFTYNQSSYCQTDADPTPAITGVNGGSFTSSSGLVLNATTGTIDVSASTPGSYTVTYTTTGSCPNSASQAIVINAAGNTSFTYSTTSYCQSALNPTPTITGNQGGTFSSTTGLTINANTGQVDLANSTVGTYTVTYTVTGACGSTSTQTVTVAPVDNASFSYSQNGYCQTDADPTPTITGVNGGTFSSTGGLVLNTSTGTIDVSASTPGTYTITYTTTGVCPNSTSQTVAINAAGNTSFVYSLASYCQSATDPTPTIAGSQGGTFTSTAGLVLNASTGTVDLSASTGGTYTITYTVTGTCGSVSTQTLTITPNNANFSYNQNSYCQADPDPTPTLAGTSSGLFSSINGLAINAGTGRIDVSASTPGTYTVTYTVNSICPNSSTQTVVINATDNANFAYASNSFCQNTPNPTPTIAGVTGGTFSSTAGLVLNANTGEIDLTASALGSYIITYATNGSCPNTGTQTVIINANSNASFAYANTSYCQTDNDPIPAITGTTGGQFSSTTGLVINANTGEIDLSTSTAGTYTITYNIGGSCPTTATQSITVNAAGGTNFSYSNASYCQSANDPIPTITGVTGGQFSSTAGLVINPTSGAIDVSASTLGTYNVTYTVGGPCGGSSNVSVTINSIDNANFSYNTTAVCQNGTDPVATLTGTTGGAFSSTGGLSLNTSTGVIDASASTAGTYVVSYTTVGICANSSTQTIVINATEDATFAYSATSTCIGGNNLTATITGTIGGSFTATPTGLSLNAGTGLINASSSTAGTYTVTYTTGGTCSSNSSTTITIGTPDDATFAYSTVNYCQNVPDPIPTVTQTGGAFTASPAGLDIDVVTGEVDLSNSTIGNYMITYTTNGTCPDSSTQALSIVTANSGAFTYSSSAYCQSNSVDPIPTITGVTGGTFSSTAGLTIDSVTGEIDLSSSVLGSYIVTYTVTTGCPDVGLFVVNILTQGIVNFGYTDTTVCLNYGNPMIPLTSANAGTFSSTPAGLVFADPGTGEVDGAGSTPGVYTVRYTTSGNCPTTRSVTVTADICTGIQQLEKAANYQLYPNPNTGAFLLEYEGAARMVEVTVLDVLGKVVHFEEVTLGATTPVNIDMLDATTGTYLVRLRSEQGVSVVKMVVVRP
ncbi:MAG: T9SS type A sorting domain-containing protein [Aureispira sp.]